MASQQQEQENGDGTNFVLVFAGALLKNAEKLVRMVCIGWSQQFIFNCLKKKLIPMQPKNFSILYLVGFISYRDH